MSHDTKATAASSPLTEAAERLRDRRAHFVRVSMDGRETTGWFTDGTIRHFVRRGYRVEGAKEGRGR